jgi:hypothetical protein
VLRAFGLLTPDGIDVFSLAAKAQPE